MKNNNLTIIILLLIIISILMLNTCNKKPEQIKIDNKYLEQKLDGLHHQIIDLKLKNDSIQLKLSNLKSTKEETIRSYENHYRTIYDSITFDSIECLPKPQVDSIKFTYQNIINVQDTLLKVKTKTIEKVSEESEIKSEIIINKSTELKREKPKKFWWGLKGAIAGFLIGKTT